MKSIIVDDNKTFREGLRYYIENILKYEVLAVVENGSDFLLLDNFNAADFIIMDIQMPVLNGIETVEKALWEYKDLIFIAITSYADHTSLAELISAGFKACILKTEIYDKLQETLNLINSGSSFIFPKAIKAGKL